MTGQKEMPCLVLEPCRIWSPFDGPPVDASDVVSLGLFGFSLGRDAAVYRVVRFCRFFTPVGMFTL